MVPFFRKAFGFHQPPLMLFDSGYKCLMLFFRECVCFFLIFLIKQVHRLKYQRSLKSQVANFYNKRKAMLRICFLWCYLVSLLLAKNCVAWIGKMKLQLKRCSKCSNSSQSFRFATIYIAIEACIQTDQSKTQIQNIIAFDWWIRKVARFDQCFGIHFNLNRFSLFCC